MDSDIKAIRLTATGDIRAQRCRIRGVSWSAAATAGTIVIKEGGGSGTTVATIDTAASLNATDNFMFPGRGILCDPNAHATLTNVTAVTFYYEG